MDEASKPGLFTLVWFRPLWKRLAVIAVIIAWCAWEWLFNKDQFWGLITLAMLGYGIWTFFINFDKELARQEANAKAEDKG